MKILTILTGGTIGSNLDEKYISLNLGNTISLLDEYSNLDITTITPYTILSEQLNGEHLNLLIKTINENKNNFDGIIVTLGTDTLQYVACALSCVFTHISIPVVLVSSNFILTDPRANGKDNFKYAIKFLDLQIGGVFASYKNTGSYPEIHQGHHLIPFETYKDELKSLNGAFGYFENDTFIQKGELDNPTPEKNHIFTKNSNVLFLKIQPGISYPDTDNLKAILLEGFHSGTLPTHCENFKNFCLNAKCPIFLVGTNQNIPYESTKEFETLNITPLTYISPVLAYIKLWLSQ